MSASALRDEERDAPVRHHARLEEAEREVPRLRQRLLQAALPSPVTRFFEGGRVSQTLDGVSKHFLTLLEYIERLLE